jgi:nucleoside-diphosphate-sugar epimerase
VDNASHLLPARATDPPLRERSFCPLIRPFDFGDLSVLRLFVFGLGYVGQAFAEALIGQGLERRRDGAGRRSRGATAGPGDRARRRRRPRRDDGRPDRRQRRADHRPAHRDGCPGLEATIPALAAAQAFPDWIGYLSTTGVYGDFEGRWVFESSPLKAQSVEGARRVGAERDWRQVGRGMGLTVTTFRLPGIYGPGRSALDRLRAGEGRRIVKPGQVFSRIHLEDIVSGLLASLDRPRAGGVYLQPGRA